MTVVKLTKKTQKLGELYLEHQRLKEVDRLAEELAKSKAELRLMAIELSQIERDINKFLDEYYGSLSDILDYKAQDIKISQNPANTNSSYKNEFSENDSVNEIIKKLYKKLSKICHPDIQGNDSISKFFTTVTDAYDAKNLQELMRIEEFLSGELDEENLSPRDKLETLSVAYDEVLEKIEQIRKAKNSLMQSPEYELKRQVLWAQMCGEDLISKIKQGLYKQIQGVAAENL